MTDLKKSVSQVGCLSEELLWKCLLEIQDASLPWKEEYREYQSSGWQTVTLMNPTGNYLDNVIYDGAAIPTSLLSDLPYTADLLESLSLKVMWARVACLKPNSFLWEHIDYKDLSDVRKVRIHIPLTTNSRSEICFSKNNVHMGVGFIWKLNPIFSHAVCNLGASDRLHLILDCYLNEKLEKMIADEWIDSEFVRQKMPFDDAFTDSLMSLNAIGFKDSALSLILKLFHKYDLTPKTSYDIATIYLQKNGYLEEAKEWQEKKIKYLGRGVVS